MAKGQELPFRSTLDDSDYEAKMRRMEATGKRVAGSVSGYLKGLASPILAIGPAIAAAFTGRAIASGVGQIFDAGRSLRALQRETGAGVAGLVVLQSKFKQAGLDSELVGTSIFRLQKSIDGIEDDENKGGAGAIASLGLNLAQLQKLSPDQQLLKVGDAISRIKTPAERTATAMQIFGRSGAQLGAVFNKPGFAEIAPGLQQKAEMMARNAEAFERISIKLERVGGILKTFYAGVADRFAGGLEPLLDRLEKVNLVAIGQAFGDSLSQGAKAMLPVVEGLVKGIPTAVTFLTSGLSQLRAMLADDMRVIAAIQRFFGGDPEAAKKKQIEQAQAKVHEDELNVAAYEGQVNDPFIRANAKRLANRQQWLARAREQLQKDADALRQLTDAPDENEQNRVVITASKFGNTALDLSSEDIARREGRAYTGARNADAFIAPSSWNLDHGFGNSITGLFSSGLSGGGLGGAYGRTGNIWHHGGRGNRPDHMAVIAKHVEATAKHTETIARGVSSSGGGSSGGVTVAN